MNKREMKEGRSGCKKCKGKRKEERKRALSQTEVEENE